MARPFVFSLRALLGVFFAVSLGISASAAGGSISINQVSPLENYFGEWTLINPEGDEIKSLNSTRKVTEAIVGGYLLLIDPPTGVRTVVEIRKNGEIIATETIPRARFSLAEGEQWEITIKYELTSTGEVSVVTAPPGVAFTLKGPEGLLLRGTTPASFNPVPVGLYSVKFTTVEGCPDLPAKSGSLQRFGRVSLSLVLECTPAAMARLAPGSGRTLEFVSVRKGTQTIVFTDVPIGVWFAPFVHIVARVGIMAGYNNSDGLPAGRFGPNDPVNLAQLSKIAHEVAGIDETKARGAVRNLLARGAWFESYYRSAEQRSWQLFFHPAEDPSRLATRGEVLATLLQALDVPRIWPRGGVFSDVTPTTPYADSIETAAASGIVSGNDDGTFQPTAPVNRAELSKMLAIILEVYGQDTPEITGRDPRDAAPRASTRE